MLVFDSNFVAYFNRSYFENLILNQIRVRVMSYLYI